MPTAEEIQIVNRDLVIWGAFDRAARAELTSCAVVVGQALVLFDPIKLTESAVAELCEVAPPCAVASTGTNTRRDTDAFIARFGIREMSPDPREWKRLGFELIEFAGSTPGEVAYHFPSSGILIVGEAISNIGGTLAMLPRKLQTAPKEFTRSLRRVGAIPFRVCCFARGMPIVRERGDGRLEDFFV